MKTIYFVRHAKSSWKEFGLADHDRPLNKRGKRDAPFMGDLMLHRNLIPEYMISSSAKRAFDTAKRFAKTFGWKEKEIMKINKLYHSDTSTILSVVNDLPNDCETVMLFVHNPGITDVVNYCSNSNIFNVPTCAIAGIEFEADDWEEVDDNGKLVLYEYPKKYYNEFGEGPLLQP